MLYEVFQIILGIFVGVITGLFPGLHVNLILPWIPGMFAIGVAISHTFFDFIPSLLLGVPDESSAIASLPGHRLVMKGRGVEAFVLSVVGGLFSSIFLIPVVVFASMVEWSKLIVISFVLISFAILILHQKSIVNALLTFLLSASVSFIINPFSYGVLPVYFTGLFGMPLIIESLVIGSHVPKQKRPGTIKINWRIPILSAIGGLFSGLLPGITSSVAAISLDSFFRFTDRDKVLLVGGINTSYVLSTVFAVWVVGKPRSGLAIAVRDLGLSVIPAMYLAVAVSAVLALFLGVFIFSKLSEFSRWLNFLALCSLLVITFSFYPRLTTLFVLATSLGVLIHNLGITRSVGLGFIILPIALNYLCGI